MSQNFILGFGRLLFFFVRWFPMFQINCRSYSWYPLRGIVHSTLFCFHGLVRPFRRIFNFCLSTFCLECYGWRTTLLWRRIQAQFLNGTNLRRHRLGRRDFDGARCAKCLNRITCTSSSSLIVDHEHTIAVFVNDVYWKWITIVHGHWIALALIIMPISSGFYCTLS